jgi:hypothetical protein
MTHRRGDAVLKQVEGAVDGHNVGVSKGGGVDQWAGIVD